MVECMGGSSLSIAPAFVIGCLVDLADIDAPLQVSNHCDGTTTPSARAAL
jgi:hypothetical protein